MPRHTCPPATQGKLATAAAEPSTPPPRLVYQLKVRLNGTRRPIWRRLLVPGEVRLAHLHTVLQVAMGWQDAHLHQFIVGGRIYGQPDFEWEAQAAVDWVGNENQVFLQAMVKSGDTFIYEYDFGDGWQHEVVVGQVLPAEKGITYAVCLDGAGACPPEDVGGISGYEDFLRAVHDRAHPAGRKWVGGRFDPDAFSPSDVNLALASLLA
jgi:hypothetical protein